MPYTILLPTLPFISPSSTIQVPLLKLLKHSFTSVQNFLISSLLLPLLTFNLHSRGTVYGTGGGGVKCDTRKQGKMRQKKITKMKKKIMKTQEKGPIQQENDIMET